MAPYDSDDSLDDKEDYTETDVLLGYASKEANGETISRLGGRPEWPDSSNLPSATLARCKVCNDHMVLLLQLNAELRDRFPGHERRLYVFSCRRKTCRRKEGSIRALRATKVSKEATAAAERAKARHEREAREKEERERAETERREKEKGLGEALFGVQGKGLVGAGTGSGSGPINPFSVGGGAAAAGANPFANPGSGATNNPFSSTSPPTAPAPTDSSISTEPATQDTARDLPKTFAQALNLNNPKQTHGPPPPPEPWPLESEQPKPYPVSWLVEADYETLDPLPPPPQNVQTTNMDIDDGGAGSGSGGGAGKEDKDVFESTMDSAFQKFADRLSQNPDQCIRYEFGGHPLLYSKTDAVGKRLHDATPAGRGMPPCGSCGCERTFEVQMTPQAIAELEREEDGLEGMDWGTIIVGVCGGDCTDSNKADGEAGYVEEWVGVQWEELTQKR